MMRLARRASMLVAFSLLTSAATAYAECAWVLWSYNWVDNPSGFSQYDVTTAHETRRECETEMVSIQAKSLKRLGYEVKGDFAGSREVLAQRGDSHWRVFWLPDYLC